MITAFYKKYIPTPEDLASSPWDWPGEWISSMGNADEIRWIIGRLLQSNPGIVTPPNYSELQWMVDIDILEAEQQRWDENIAASQEFLEAENRLRELLKSNWSVEEYRKYQELVRSTYHLLIKRVRISQIWKVKNHSLSERERTLLGQQIIRDLQFFVELLESEIQNIHNHAKKSKVGYSESVVWFLGHLTEMLERAESEIERLTATNHEIAIQRRMDEVLDNRAILRREQHRKKNPWKSAYIETPSRKKLIYWDNNADRYMLWSLRAWQNIELLGPTGTGKTQVAIQAARVFSGKDPVIVSGWPWVYRSTFFGSPKWPNTRDPWAVIKCLIEDRVLIIDEDNRIDPRNMAEIKLILWLRPGDTYTHPDTGENYTVPPHFRVIVTRNELGKHHQDRFPLPPDYRREFTHGSFEVDYYSPSEMYNQFLIPKLANSHGSIDLPLEDIGWDIRKKHYSPLLALVLAGEKIQKEYKATKLKNAVFESGFMIDLLDQWHEVRFKKITDKQSTQKRSITFLEYLETKLIEFIRRPIGNPDRKIITDILMEHGFFMTWWKREDFATANEGEVYTEDEWKKKVIQPIFRASSETSTSPQEVALLDPWNERKIVIPPHPLEEELWGFRQVYQQFCQKFMTRPKSFTAHSFESQKSDIIDSIVQALRSSKISNKELYASNIEQIKSRRTSKQTVGELIKMVSTVLNV
jgi:hypothetical protein